MVSMVYGNPDDKPLSTHQPGAFLKHWMEAHDYPSDTLVILDLDDTAITTPDGQWLGQSAMFYDMLNPLKQRYPDKRTSELAHVVDPLLTEVYKRVPVIATDPLLPDVLKALIDRDITVIGMTARGGNMADVTMMQLSKAGIRFSELDETSRRIDLDSHRQFRVEQAGVVFVSQGNSKGETLVQLLNRDFIKRPERVIFIDDRKKHLNSVFESLTGYPSAIDYLPVYCSYPETKEKYDSTKARHQLIRFLKESKNIFEVNQLIKQDPYTRDLLSECRDDHSSSDRHDCVNLLSERTFINDGQKPHE